MEEFSARVASLQNKVVQLEADKVALQDEVRVAANKLLDAASSAAEEKLSADSEIFEIRIALNDAKAAVRGIEARLTDAITALQLEQAERARQVDELEASISNIQQQVPASFSFECETLYYHHYI